MTSAVGKIGRVLLPSEPPVKKSFRSSYRALAAQSGCSRVGMRNVMVTILSDALLICIARLEA